MNAIFYAFEKKKNSTARPGSGVSSATIAIELKDDTSVFKPVMIVNKAALGQQWANANYAYIPEFGGRYYFIDDIEALTGSRLAFHLSVDVLKTYRDQIINQPFMIARSEDINSPYFVDAERVIQSKKLVYYKKLTGASNIPQSSTGNKFAITVAGGT